MWMRGREPNAGLTVRVDGVYYNERMSRAQDDWQTEMTELAGWTGHTCEVDNINDKTVNRRKLRT